MQLNHLELGFLSHGGANSPIRTNSSIRANTPIITILSDRCRASLIGITIIAAVVIIHSDQQCKSSSITDITMNAKFVVLKYGTLGPLAVELV